MGIKVQNKNYLGIKYSKVEHKHEGHCSKSSLTIGLYFHTFFFQFSLPYDCCE